MRFILSPIIALYILLLRLTCTVKVYNDDKLSHTKLPKTQAIYAIWHGRLLLAAPFWLQKSHKSGRYKMTMLSSSHKDGKMIAAACKLLRFNVVFGSSTRGGAAALRGLIRASKKGQNIFITPDGPKGPSQKAKPGIAEISRLASLPIVPLGASSSKNVKILQNWDNFHIITPFSTIFVTIGQPVKPAKDKTGQQNQLKEVEKSLKLLQQKADLFAQNS